MITSVQAEVGKIYTVESIQANAQARKHLNNLGVAAGQVIVLINYQNQNGIVLLHNSRVALTDTILQAIRVEECSANEKVWVSLNILKVGERVTIVGIHGRGAVKRRLMDMSLTRGTVIFIRKIAPLVDPVETNVRGYELTLRKSEAELTLTEKEESE